jgi:N-terminal acetyltransferase B complex non-catalytic subunit
MEKNTLMEKEKYIPILMKNKIKHGNNKKGKETEKNKNIEKMIYFLSDKKERNSFTFFKTFIGNSDDLSKDILNKKLIKVNTDNKSKSKNSKCNSSCLTSSVKSFNQKNKSKGKISETDLSMNQKINKFESRIDNLLNVINDFEEKFINSPETQKIKEEFNSIINKKIYQDKINKNNLFKSFNKNEKDKCINNINNINININNNNYENNYFITQSINDVGQKVLDKNSNYSDKKLNINTNSSGIIKKSNLKQKKKISKCNSNDLKNKTIHNYKEKPKLFKLPLDSINNNFAMKNKRYNNSYKELKIPLTDRKEKDIEDIKFVESTDFGNSLKNINKKKNICVKINKAASSKNEIRRKTFFKKEGINKVNLFNSKKKLNEKNSTHSSGQRNPITNINGGIKENGVDLGNIKKLEKSINNSNEFGKMKKKENAELINYILNKRNIIKSNNITIGNMHDNIIKDYNNKKILCNKKK